MSVFSILTSKDLGHIIKEKAISSEVVLGVRPEDVNLENQKPKKNFEAQVYVVEPLGTEVIVDLKIGDNLIKAKTSPDFRADIDETIEVSFNMKRAHIFDKKTEKVIV